MIHPEHNFVPHAIPYIIDLRRGSVPVEKEDDSSNAMPHILLERMRRSRDRRHIANSMWVRSVNYCYACGYEQFIV